MTIRGVVQDHRRVVERLGILMPKSGYVRIFRLSALSLSELGVQLPARHSTIHFNESDPKMGAFDSRSSKKMRRKKSQTKLKERQKRQAEATKAARGH